MFHNALGFHEVGLAKWQKRLNARVTGRRKQTKERRVEQLCNIPMALDESVELLSTLLLPLSSSLIFTEPLSSLNSIFLPD